MNGVSSRINGQSDYRPATQARAAWRQEMLDDILDQMRQRRPAVELPAAEAVPEGLVRKGSYVDIYV